VVRREPPLAISQDRRVEIDEPSSVNPSTGLLFGCLACKAPAWLGFGSGAGRHAQAPRADSALVDAYACVRHHPKTLHWGMARSQWIRRSSQSDYRRWMSSDRAVKRNNPAVVPNTAIAAERFQSTNVVGGPGPKDANELTMTFT
jgi:hypothetical protein